MIAVMDGAAASAGDWASRVMTAPTRGLLSRCLTEAVNDPAPTAAALHENSDAHTAACIQRIQDVFAMRDMSLHETVRPGLAFDPKRVAFALTHFSGCSDRDGAAPKL
jgi:hypothetical protein